MIREVTILCFFDVFVRKIFRNLQIYLSTRYGVSTAGITRRNRSAYGPPRDRLAGNPDFFLSLYTIVAAEDGKIVGYGNIDDTGYLDHLYVHSEFQGQGIASSICQELERYAYTMHAPKITVHASITARPFFEKRGYRVLREQQVERQGVLLTNYEMEKTAPGSHLP